MPVDYSAYMQNKRDLVPNLIKSLAGAYGAYEKTQAANQMAAQQKQMQIDFASVRDNPNAGPQDYANLMMKYPEQQQRIKGVYDMLGEEKRRAKQAESLQLFSLLEGGENEMALKSLNDRRLAAETSGNQKEAQQAQTMIDMINSNPSAAKNMAGMYLSMTMGPEKFAETYKKIQETRELRGKEQLNIDTAAEELGLKKAQANKIAKETEKLGVQIQKDVLELEAAKNPETGIVDPKVRFEKEENLRKEYDKKSTGLTESERSYDILKTSAQDQSGAGDVALITSFMKMLDPGSVVRETEFATARNTAGLFASLENALQKAQTGKFLNDSQRKTFVNLAGKYLRAAKLKDKEVRADLGKVVENYKLNPDNVFGVSGQQEIKAEPSQNDILSQADAIIGL